MPDRLVSVGDDLKLPAAVTVPPARLEGSAAFGRSLLAAADAAAARSAIGAVGLAGPTAPPGYLRQTLGAFRALAVDPAKPDRVYGSNASNVLYWDNYTGTGSAVVVGPMPTTQSAIQLVFSTAHVYLVTTGNADRLGQVWRSPLPGTATPTFTWTKIFDLTGFTTTVAAGIDGGVGSYFREQSLAVDHVNNRACVLEYGGVVTGGPSVYYTANSTSGSMLWSKRHTFANAKHGHGIVHIPGATPRFWAMLGDAGFTDLGLWSGDLAGAAWQRRSQYGVDTGGNTLYGINLHPVNLNGADVFLTDNDTKQHGSVLMYPTQGAATSYPLLKLVTAPLPYGVGTVRSLCLTAAGSLFWIQTGENSAVAPHDSLWVSPAPYREAVMLESFTSDNRLGTLGTAIDAGSYILVGTWRITKPAGI